MKDKRPNILFYFSDQQRPDTIGCYGQALPVTPRLDQLAKEGVRFARAFTPQPVCGPARAMIQTGVYPTATGCFRNGIALPRDRRTLAMYLEAAGYDTGYVGKWHLASDKNVPGREDTNFATRPIPPDLRGGYTGFWRASDVLEFTSHGYDGYVYDEHMNRRDFTGYRTDCITDFALEYIEKQQGEKPFFLMVSHIEPHHQNDRGHYEGPKGSKERFAGFQVPADLHGLPGDYMEEYPDYLGCCASLDENLGRIIDALKEKGIYENTVILYTSDHGSHFRTRNRDDHLNGFDDYKRSCHDSCLQVPLIMAGPGVAMGRVAEEVVSTAGITKTILALAGIEAGDEMAGENLAAIGNGEQGVCDNEAFAQISESRVGRCLRTERYLYSVYAPGKHGNREMESDVYHGDFLYDLEDDPYQRNNLIDATEYRGVRLELAQRLLRQMAKAGEKIPQIIEGS